MDILATLRSGNDEYRLAACVEAADTIEKERRRATDAEYMVRAFRNMLGPTALRVAQMWDKKRVQRVHFDWGPTAREMTGEERAQFILDLEDAPKRQVAPGEL